ncbi:winged helix DNA-binding domain-containing protein [Humibacter sp.]|uniref:winged helix DNA-binding domain-containing protein n=1 Tax=Humibacter sp. TaxID=1940291 RepID=UPI003F7F49A6
MTASPQQAWLRAERLRSQHLDGRSATPLEVVRALGAVQAQNGSAARWAIGVRSPGSVQADIERLFESGDLVRSWTMRGTLHIVAADDLDWMLALTSSRQRAAVAREARLRGMTEDELQRASELIAEDVERNGPRTRAEALSTLERAGIAIGDERGYRFIRDAALRGRVAWGPMRGKQPQLVLVRPAGQHDRDELLARYLVRYVAGHAPATVRDFAWWSGLTLTDARRARDAAGSAIETVGEEEWLIEPGRAPGDPAASAPSPVLAAAPLNSFPRLGKASKLALRSPQSAVQAIPGWDEYVLGYGDRSPVLDPEFAPRVSATGNGVFLPTIVSAGRIVGTWRQGTKGSHLVAEAQPFIRLTAAEKRGFDASAARLARFLGLDGVSAG